MKKSKKFGMRMKGNKGLFWVILILILLLLWYSGIIRLIWDVLNLISDFGEILSMI